MVSSDARSSVSSLSFAQAARYPKLFSPVSMP